MTQLRLRLGDIIEIPILNGRKAYLHYVFKDRWGDGVVVFDDKDDLLDIRDIDTFKNLSLKFGPVLTRIREGLNKSHLQWKVVENKKPEMEKTDGFIWKDGGHASKGIRTKWYLYNGKENLEIGKNLPSKYKTYEYLTNYSPEELVKRITYGTNHDLILINEGFLSSLFSRLTS